jgi:hypothetical protein
MATNYYADRGTLVINGVEVANVKTLKFTIEESISRVDTMTKNHRTSGYKKGNRKVSGSFELAIPDQKAQLDLSFLYQGNDISVSCKVGQNSESYTLIGLVQTNSDLSASVGETSKTINFEALDAVNEGGAGVNSIVNA